MWLPLSWKTFRIGGDLSAISLNQFFLKGAHWMFYGISSSCNFLMHPCMHRSLQYPTYSKIHAPFTSRAPKKGPALKHQPALLMNVYVCMRVCVWVCHVGDDCKDCLLVSRWVCYMVCPLALSLHAMPGCVHLRISSERRPRHMDVESHSCCPLPCAAISRSICQEDRFCASLPM